MRCHRLTRGAKAWTLGLLLALGCSGKTVKEHPTTAAHTASEAGADPAASGDSASGDAAAKSDSANASTSSNAGSSATSSSEMLDTLSVRDDLATSSSTPLAPSATPDSTDNSTSDATSTRTWRCLGHRYGDGVCDCGCGAPDIDCANSDDLSACERCSGGCNLGTCPGRLDPNDNTQCVRVSPPEWTCHDAHYDDGVECHCGCGVPDPDCEGGGVDVCNVCNVEGSCSVGTCPGAIAPNDNTQCWLDENWTCYKGHFGDGVCTCGCGALDPDCPSLSRDVCELCVGCKDDRCPESVAADDNRVCSGVPFTWTCDDRYFGDGQLCNCGCGAPDPDCESSDVGACDVCNFQGSCSRQACPGTVNPNHNAHCQRPDPPPSWTCYPHAYGDGYSCDCGCGAPDPDCTSDDLRECTTCCDGSPCPSRVNPDNILECLPVPDAWRCADWFYGDGYNCECGCGVRDPDCESDASDVCVACPYDYGSGAGGCSRDGLCDTIVPDDNAHCTDEAPPDWTCPSLYYADGDACDCGCGALDPDCNGDATLSACDICNTKGSCSTAGCHDNPPLNPDNNAVCGRDLAPGGASSTTASTPSHGESTSAP